LCWSRGKKAALLLNVTAVNTRNDALEVRLAF